ncbi:acyl-phosphate glycerol-3-phosphate acyltransferase [Clostridium sp. DSM 8431]|uniref:glycerol-3-phosphate 1-O-acyltransferase PlsY n=1 Tax=Clostridium sp. DSM 8431 TaxID=1761781 RepID=UPI0008E1F124|nr:glycerol-3-phosphate 1-O-acyltransferase PlsY [Clostridium sp. DSM 8431]SFU52719.1 acyl-phosphate glycerol-3-phosphate acyltransferase [Clostridium sp. DSM 8431]
MTILILSIIISFLCGSIPTGYIIMKKFYGIDIRTKGSGNIGSTNVKRIAGVKASIGTQAGDVIKGLVPVTIAYILSYKVSLPVSTDVYLCLVAIAAVLGHDYTPFLGFNGGKGVNTTLGAFFLLSPFSIALGVIVYFGLKKATDIVSIRSLALGVTIPVTCSIFHRPMSVIITSTFASILMIYRHKENIKRLAHKEELKRG